MKDIMKIIKVQNSDGMCIICRKLYTTAQKHCSQNFSKE